MPPDGVRRDRRAPRSRLRVLAVTRTRSAMRISAGLVGRRRSRTVGQAGRAARHGVRSSRLVRVRVRSTASAIQHRQVFAIWAWTSFATGTQVIRERRYASSRSTGRGSSRPPRRGRGLGWPEVVDQGLLTRVRRAAGDGQRGHTMAWRIHSVSARQRRQRRLGRGELLQHELRPVAASDAALERQLGPVPQRPGHPALPGAGRG